MAEALRRVLDAGGAARARKEWPEPGPPLLLLGGPGSGKTSLLFAAALDAAGEGRGPVLFVTRTPLQSLPLSSRAARDPLRLQKVRFHYPPSTQELLRLLCSAHEAPGPAPSLLLLDGLEEYLAEDQGTQEAAYLAALLLDTAAYFSDRLGSNRNCGLLVALETREEAESGDNLQLGLIRRYFPAQCWLRPDAAHLGQWHLQVFLQSGRQSPGGEWLMTFLPSGEMRITLRPTQASTPSPDKKSSSAGGKA
uniref:ATPase SWSAP1 n=1 Tax=Jaculus jaculus TaxID=51337 RepID=UPI001E1B0EB2|nr:ATPase SWSAP1 [Jaculus jaculus]